MKLSLSIAPRKPGQHNFPEKDLDYKCPTWGFEKLVAAVTAAMYWDPNLIDNKRFETKNWTGLKTSKLLCIQYVWQNFSCLNLLQYMIYHSLNLWTDLSENMRTQIISYILLSYII